MKDADLIQALKRIKVQTGGLMCVGCGHEHNCGVHGCAVIREAAQRLEELLKYKAAIDRMGKFGQLFVEYEGCPRGAMGRMCDATIQEEALAMDMLTDVDMGRWRPVNEDVLQDLLTELKRVKAKRKEYQIRAAKADMEIANIQAFVVTEYCPHCEKEQSILWDAGKDGYEIYCPTCGEKIMLCSVCDEFDTCDWREDSGCKKRKKG